MHEQDTSVQAWNEVSQAYNRVRSRGAVSIDYEPFCPMEDELKMLGDVGKLHLPIDGPFASLRNIPHTLIITAHNASDTFYREL